MGYQTDITGYMGQSLRGFIGFRIGLLLLLMVGVVGEGYGQRVYADSYGYDDSGPGLSVPIVGTVILAAGLVNNGQNAVGDNSVNGSYTELFIGGLISLPPQVPFATYQLEFSNNRDDLPCGTSIYVRLDDNTSAGLLNLGLVLVSKGFVSVYSNADSKNSKSLTGDKISLEDSAVVPIKIGGVQYMKITPSFCFNAIRFSIVGGGLLGLLTTGDVKIYHAYYERPEMQVEPVDPVCHGETAILQIKDPLSTICEQEYLWYEQETGGSALPNSGSVTSQYTTPPLAATDTIMQKMYWVEYTGMDVSDGRKSVTVTVQPKLGKIHIDAN